MAPVQPTSSFCATTVCWDTKLRHLCACCPVKAVPTRNKTGIVTFVAISAIIARVVADETVCFAEHCVVWAFPRNWKQNDVISTLWPNVNVETLLTRGGSPLTTKHVIRSQVTAVVCQWSSAANWWLVTFIHICEKSTQISGSLHVIKNNIWFLLSRNAHLLQWRGRRDTFGVRVFF